jgi:uncharacterized repeat protein (TIGR01451 family)
LLCGRDVAIESDGSFQAGRCLKKHTRLNDGLHISGVLRVDPKTSNVALQVTKKGLEMQHRRIAEIWTDVAGVAEHAGPNLSKLERTCRRWSCLCAWVVLGAAGHAAAQSTETVSKPEQKAALEVVLVQSKVVKGTDGKEQLVAADTVRPGDVLEYRATYTNKSGKPVKGLLANLPIPEGLEYQANSAKPGGKLVMVATKDGRFAAEPLTRTVKGELQPVPYNEYRTVRWSLGQLPASGSAEVAARARVETVSLPPPKASPLSPQAAK